MFLTTSLEMTAKISKKISKLSCNDRVNVNDNFSQWTPLLCNEQFKGHRFEEAIVRDAVKNTRVKMKNRKIEKPYIQIE